tara:strand:+ start:1014 stop:2249 length:1236 start_codon:yes stop_codon:yes gene_type:complete
MNMNRCLKFPHYDNVEKKHENSYYHLIKNSSEKFKSEIHDIYFGKFFRYEFEQKNKFYGNAMGVESSNEQIENLFKIQNEFNIPISLTMNSLETPHELLDNSSVINQFLEFIGEFYNKGLRNCIIASNHLMKSGLLHKNFPDMRWESTVNQKCPDAQSVLDLLFNGYDTIMLDRRLNRDIKELKRVKKAVDYYNEKYKPLKKAKTCLLVYESCVYNCPFKKEHDSVGEHISANYFKGLSKLTCDNWRKSEFGKLPRNGIDIVASTKDVWNEFFKYTDIFKFSGRFTKFNFEPEDAKNMSACYLYFEHKNFHKLDFHQTLSIDTIHAKSYSEIVENNLTPVHAWKHGWIDNRFVTKDFHSYRHIMESTPNIWKTKNGKRLEKILKNCKSQCWDCHECEKTFETELFDSALQI